MSFRDEIMWLAGLLEGEGCFGIYKQRQRKYLGPQLVLTMTDEDVVRHAASIVGEGDRVYEQNFRPKAHWKSAWRWQSGGARAIGIMMMVYPFMGQRRKAKIREVVDLWKSPSGQLHRGYLCQNRKHRLSGPGECKPCADGASARNTKRMRITYRRRRYGGDRGEALFA